MNAPQAHNTNPLNSLIYRFCAIAAHSVHSQNGPFASAYLFQNRTSLRNLAELLHLILTDLSRVALILARFANGLDLTNGRRHEWKLTSRCWGNIRYLRQGKNLSLADQAVAGD